MRRSMVIVAVSVAAVLLAGTAQAVTLNGGAFSDHMWNYVETNVADSYIANGTAIKGGTFVGKTTFTPEEIYYGGDPTGANGRATDHSVYMVAGLTGLGSGNIVKRVVNAYAKESGGAWFQMTTNKTSYILVGAYTHLDTSKIDNWLVYGDDTSNDWVFGSALSIYPDGNPPALLGCEFQYTQAFTVYQSGTLTGQSTSFRGYTEGTGISGAGSELFNGTYDTGVLKIVPEPLTMLGMFLGLGSVGAYIRRRRSA